MTVFRTTKISDLTADSSIDGTETVVVAQGGSNYKVTFSQLLTWIQAQIIGVLRVFDIAGYAADSTTAVPEGSVLTYTKTSSADDAGTLDFSYMPLPHTYSPGAMSQSYAAGYPVPGIHIHNGAGTLAANVNIDDWVIGVVHDFWQVGNGRITVEIGSGGTSASSVYLDAYTNDGTHVGTYNGVYTPSIRSTGVGARFSVVRASTYVFMAVGGVEDVP